MIAVNKSYFKDTKSYISQKEWLEMWRDVTGNSEITQVHIQKVKQNNNKEQVLVYSGLFKDARKKLKNGELDYLKEVDPTEYIYQIFYTWNKKEYLASEIFDLTESEKQEINHQMIDEIEEEK